jgi:hypothetical protein
MKPTLELLGYRKDYSLTLGNDEFHISEMYEGNTDSFSYEIFTGEGDEVSKEVEKKVKEAFFRLTEK